MEAARSAVPAGSAADEQGPAQEALLLRAGQMTRSLRGLDFDKLAERAAHDIPDARDRLDCVARSSGSTAVSLHPQQNVAAKPSLSLNLTLQFDVSKQGVVATPGNG